MRLDLFILKKYQLKSRTYASQLIKRGKVFVNNKIIYKVSENVNEQDDITIDLSENYASQGAFKLKKAIDYFSISIDDKICADFGCSNGGFTDILLKNNAKHVYAFDVADCALDKMILASKNVTFIKCNLRYLPENTPKVDFLCCDVSFISLTLIIPSIFRILNNKGEGIILIKPQFEAGKKYINKSGIVKDKKIHEKVISNIMDCLKTHQLKPINIITSPIYYEDKNIEYLLYFKKD